MRFPIVVTVLFLCHGYARADEREDKLPEAWRKWLKEEVVYIISDVEREAFLSLESETERQAFESAFWRQRDTNPSTPENEYKIEHYARLEHAKEFLGRDTFRPGGMTDRGRYYILLGPPNTVQNFDHDDSVYPVELWFYNDSKLKQFGLPPYFYLLFFRRQGGGELELYSPAIDGPQELLTGYQYVSMDRRDDVEAAYDKLFEIHPELAHASLSFRTDEGDTATFNTPSFGTIELINDIARAPFRGVDTSYASRLDFERGAVESDFLFSFVPSRGSLTVFPGPAESFFLHWVVEIDPQYVAVVKDVDRDLYGSLFISTIELTEREDPHRVVVQTRKESFLRLNEADVRRGGLSGPYAFRGMTPVVPGAYDVRIILRNRACPSREERDCIRSYTLLDGEVVIPSWGQARPGLSDVVLAYEAERPGGEPAYRPFRFGSVEVHPNPGGVYSLGEPLIAAVEPLGSEPGSLARFRVFGAEDETSVRVERSVPVDGFRLEPIVSELSLDTLDAGYYRLQTDLVDPSGKVVNSRSVPFAISPRTRVGRPAVRGALSSIIPEVPGAVAMALGDQYFLLGNRAAARIQYEAALASNAQLGPAIEAVAVMEMEDGNAARVIELLAPVYQQVQDRYVVLALLGEAYFREKEYSRAVEILERAIVLQRPSASILNSLAISYHQLGDVGKAKSLLERSLELEPNQPKIRELLETLG